jgi:hypothetical protein
MKIFLISAILLAPAASFAMPHMEVICESLDGTVKASIIASSYSGDSTGGASLSHNGTEYRESNSGDLTAYMGQYWNDQSRIFMKIGVPGKKFNDAFSAAFVFRTEGSKAKKWRLEGELEISTKELHDSQDQVIERKPAVCYNNP